MASETANYNVPCNWDPVFDSSPTFTQRITQRTYFKTRLKRCFGEILQKNFKFAWSQQLCEHLPLFIKSFIYHIIYLRESRRRKSKSCRRMRRPTADFENTGIQKADVKCWLVEMKLQCSNAIITLSACRINVCLHSRSFLLPADWQKSDSSVKEEPQGNWRQNSNSRGTVVNFPSFPCPAPERPEELACRLPRGQPRFQYQAHWNHWTQFRSLSMLLHHHYQGLKVPF